MSATSKLDRPCQPEELGTNTKNAWRSWCTRGMEEEPNARARRPASSRRGLDQVDRSGDGHPLLAVQLADGPGHLGQPPPLTVFAGATGGSSNYRVNSIACRFLIVTTGWGQLGTKAAVPHHP